MVSLDTLAPYTSSKWAAISPVVNPRADSDNTIWSIPSRRRFRFGTITGVNEPSRSRGTSISTGPISVNTVFDREPLRMFIPRGAAPYSWPRCSVSSASRADSSTCLVSPDNNPPGPTRDIP